MTAWQFKPNARRPETALTWFQSWLLSRGGSRFKSVRENPGLYPGRVVRNTVAVAARRSGKTVGSRLVALTACLDDGPGDVGYMAPTLGQAKRIFWRPLIQDLKNPAAKAFIDGKPNHSELTVEFKSGTRLYLYSAEAYERVRGDGFKLFITDETDDPRFTDAVFDEAVGPALKDNRGSLIQLGTPKGRGRLYKEFNKGDPNHATHNANYDSIQVTAIEAGLLDPEEIAEAERTTPKRAFDQEYRATFNAAIGVVYDEFDREVHVKRCMPPALDNFAEVIVGVDWGIVNRGTMLVIGIDYVDVDATDEFEAEQLPRAWLLEEFTYAGKPYSYSADPGNFGWWTLAQRIQREYQPSRWYCDPAGGDAEETDAKAAGYLRQLQEALASVDRRAKVIAADNSITHGISAVASFVHHAPKFGEPARLFIMGTKCANIITEFESYRWDSPRGGGEDELIERPIKKNDHSLDSLRYALLTHFYSKRRKSGRNDAGFDQRQ